MNTREIFSKYAGTCAACGRTIKSGKKVLFNTASRQIFHNHRDYGDCPDRANEQPEPRVIPTIRDTHSEYYTSGQYDRDEEPEV